MIIINRKKAEEMVRERLRVLRSTRLEDLDAQFIRAIEVGADTSSIAHEKQLLRDVTERDLAHLDIEQLGSLTLDEALALP